MPHCGSRQCGLREDAADPHAPPGKAVGQMDRNTMEQGHSGASGNPPSSGETVFSHPGEGGLCLHQEGPPSLRSVTCCWPVRCQLLPVLLPWPHVKSLCLPRTLVWAQEDPLLEVLVITTAVSRGTAELPSDMQLI